jgi:predicted nucleic acid-binding Zn ribbon protein
MPNQEFKNISSILGSILNNYGLKKTVERKRLIDNWDDIVGKALSKHCKPVKIENEVLFLEAKNNVWKNELSLRQMDLLELIRSKFDHRLVKKIRFI